MATANKKIDRKLLRTFDPLNQLAADKFEEIIDKSTVEEIPAGRNLFRQGDRDKRAYFLLQGQVELSVLGRPKTTLIKAKTREAQQPLVNEIPRSCTCKSKGATVFIADIDLLDMLLCEHSSSDAIEVTELSAEDEANDWMLRFLNSSTFLNLPTENIQRMLMKMEEVRVRKDKAVVRQGESDDYYYIVKRGQCAVSRRPAPQAEDVRVAILSIGDGFGEEALITNGKRNATVTMLEDGKLMRLHKDDFIPLLVTPLLDFINDDAAETLINGGSHLIDVRTHDQFEKNGLPGATNIPLSALRTRVTSLNPDRDYIVYCEDGSHSSAAAFLMTQQGLTCRVLEGGLANSRLAAASKKASKPAAKARKAAAKPAKAAPKKPAAAPKATSKASPPRADTTKTRTGAAKPAASRSGSGLKDVVSPVARRQADEAEEAKRRAQQEAEALRKQAEELARRTQEAEKAREAARMELERVKKEEIARKEAELEAARKEAEEQARRAKEAEEARKKALEEAKRIKKEKQSRHEKELEAALRRAEEETRRARAAEEARQKALQEAEKMKSNQRSKYDAELEEARKRAEDEAIRAKMAEESRQRAIAEAEALKSKLKSDFDEKLTGLQSRAAEEARRAKEAEEARKAAEREARKLRDESERIKHQVVEETERLRQEAETTRQMAEQELERIRLEAERAAERQRELEAERERAKREAQAAAEAAYAARAQAERDARRLRQEAEAIRQEAQAEAERLRAELEATRRQMAQEAARAREEAEETARLRREASEAAEAQAAAEAAAQARIEAELAAEAMRKAEEEARRIQAEQAVLAKKQAASKAAARARAEEQARARAEEQARARARAEAEAARRRAEELAAAEEEARQRLAEEKQRLAAQAKSEAKARSMAEDIVAKLHSADQARKAGEDPEAEGMTLAPTSVRESRGRTILEGDEDIFIFQPPRADREGHDDDDEDEIEHIEITGPRDAVGSGSDDDLPSFKVSAAGDNNTSGEFDFSDIAPMRGAASGTSGNAALERERTAGNGNRKKGMFMAMAASLVLVLGGGYFALTQDATEVEDIAAIVDGAGGDPKQVGGLGDRTRAVARVKQEAEEEFNRLLQEWEATEIQPAADDAAIAADAVPESAIEEAVVAETVEAAPTETLAPAVAPEAEVVPDSPAPDAGITEEE
ncbi:MAG TPA: cyclic nucleotide-binding domain-containing protein [Gammaproteobacteria bacterium]|nr:cyclic nucleotide-binding domain-containing protein [Gammaproteobacteria bacterium]